MKAGIIISAYNNPGTLRRCLHAVARQTRLPDEVAVADDGSERAVRQVCEEFSRAFPRLIHVWHDDRDFRKARIVNCAVSQCASEYLIMTDSDCLPERHFVADHLRLARRGQMVQGTRAHVLAHHQSGFAPTALQIWDGVLRNRISHRQAALRSWLRYRWQPPDHWNMPLGANLSVYRDDFLALNGMDESFVGYGGEDMELFNRYKANGMPIVFPVSVCLTFHLDHPRLPPAPGLEARHKEVEKKMAKSCEVGIRGSMERMPLPVVSVWEATASART